MKYAYKTYTENMARASGRHLGISFKQSIEITRHLRGRNVSKAKAILEEVIAMKKPIPFLRFTNGLGHKPGMAAGRYPIKACKEILAVIEAAEANAQNKGLGTCTIVHIAAQPAARPFHYGRRRRIRTRRAHIEVVLKETEPAKRKDKKDKEKTDGAVAESLAQEARSDIKKEEKESKQEDAPKNIKKADNIPKVRAKAPESQKGIKRAAKARERPKETT